MIGDSGANHRCVSARSKSLSTVRHARRSKFRLPPKKVICTGWIGRFGNQCHSYLFAKHLEHIFGCSIYVPSRWAGSVLFRNAAPVLPSEFEHLCPEIAAGSTHQENFERSCEAIAKYNEKAGDALEFVDPNKEEHYGKVNIAFRSLATDAEWFYPKVSRADIKGYFAFSDELRQSDVYGELEAAKGTYDVAHLRRTDIAAPGYVGGHSMVSRRSYHAAFKEFGCDPEKVVWVSDEPTIGWKWNGACPIIGGMEIPWLPDFLKLVFARRMFRSNSSFSTWAGWLGNAEVISPWLHRYAPGEELDVSFVRGNHPHWMSVKGAHASYRFRLKGEASPEPVSTPTVSVVEVGSRSADTRPANLGQRNRIMLVHWVGRFANRMFSVAFGRHYAETFDHDFYVPSEWEGSALFEDCGCKVIDDDELRLRINQTHPALHTFQYRQQSVAEYCQRTDRQLTFIDPNRPEDYGKKNVYFDSGCSHTSHLFERYSRKRMKEWFQWSDAVKSLDLYKHLEQIQGTYDIAHLRRDDVSSPNYNQKHFQAYSVVSKASYSRAFRLFGYDPAAVQWTADDTSGKWMPKPSAPRRGGWTYPIGSHRSSDIIFDWLPDFLRLYFARTIFRANSGFSWWAAFLSPCAKVYSPVLRERKVYLREGDELNCEFVAGNHPHWMNAASDQRCPEIRIPT